MIERIRSSKDHIGKKVKHFKGGEYIILGIAKDSETKEDMVVYKALYDDCDIWIRPVKMFDETVDKNKYPNSKQHFRFEFI